MADWQAVKTEYITTDISYRKLAPKYGLSVSQVERVGRRENWVALRGQHRNRVVSRSVAAAEDEQVGRVQKYRTVADKMLRKIESVLDSPEPVNEKTLRDLTAAFKNLNEVMGMKSELDEQEQLARIANLKKQAQKEDADSTIEIVLAAGEEAWNE